MNNRNTLPAHAQGAQPGEPGRPVSADIDLSAISRNAHAIKNLIGPDCELMAVVKANGYGLGATWVARAALEGGASRLAVACRDEGVELRRAGFTCPILVMGYTSPGEAASVVEHRLTVTLHHGKTASALQAAAEAAGMPPARVPVHIKVDTGLGRYGCSVQEFLPLARFVRRCPHLHLEGLMTHFSDADTQDLSFAREQLAHFVGLRREAAAHGIEFELTHAAHSAATLALPEARFDMVRIGIMLGGHYPSPLFYDKAPLQPAVTLRTRLVRVFQVESGESVGYGRTWSASRPSIIGLIPMGYGDGFVRLLSNRGCVLVGGRRCPVAGRISMDQSAIDLTGLPGAQEGDEAVLIGKQGEGEITADEFAGWADTISYEILCGLAARVPKRYIREGRVVGVCDLLGCEDVMRNA